ncbi:MAG: glycosyltransferase [Chitinivibrionales bacterium]
MTTMLIISRYCAYDSASYAGSKTHNYYLKRLIKDFQVKVLTIAHPEDLPGLDFDKYKIDADIVLVNEAPRRAWFFLLHNWRNVLNYFGKTLGLVNGYVQRSLLKRARLLQRQGYSPDIILFEWTQTLLVIKDVKKLFPSALCIASEHDVSFLRFERQYKAASGLNKIKENIRYKSLKKVEISALQKADLIVPQNEKDKNLLLVHGISPEKVHAIAPYYTNYNSVMYSPAGTNILFFGAMDRKENYAGIIWFIDRVFKPYLSHGYSLVIVGGRPHRSLSKYKSDRITITGFVQDIRPYLANSFCMVAPLLSGAGIKVKVIEVMSAGLPVLASGIAIEGIPAQNEVHYLHCEQPEDYREAFERIRQNQIDLRGISENSKNLVAENFNLEKSFTSYREAILKSLRNKNESQF